VKTTTALFQGDPALLKSDPPLLQDEPPVLQGDPSLLKGEPPAYIIPWLRVWPPPIQDQLL